MDAQAEDKREKVRWVILASGVALAFYLCWLMLQPFVKVLLWGLVLTSAFAPLHDRILARYRRPDLAASGRGADETHAACRHIAGAVR